MCLRQIAIAAAAAALAASPAAAETAEKAQAPAQSEQQPAPTVLASANVQLPAQLKQDTVAPATKRPRAARVTSCRCGESAAPKSN